MSTLSTITKNFDVDSNPKMHNVSVTTKLNN